MSIPNYENYSLDELWDSLNHIDKERFPERVEIIKNEIKLRKNNSNELVNTEKKTINSILENSEISSDITFIYKYIFPVIFTVAFGVISIHSFYNSDTLDFSLDLFSWLFGSPILILFVKDLKKVKVDIMTRSLHVSNFFKLIKIPFSNIESINNSVFFNPKTITILLKTNTEFGNKIKFIPRESYQIVKELKEILNQSPYNKIL